MTISKILAAAFSEGASLIVSWAALHYDSALLVAGLLILLAITLIWIFVAPAEFGRRAPVALRSDDAPADLDSKARALFYLERTRANGHAAHANRSGPEIEQALSEILAALNGTAKAFAFGEVSLEIEGIGRRRILGLMLRYVDSFYFLLRQGHVEEAERAARALEIG